MNPFIANVTAYRFVIGCILQLSFRRFHMETSSYNLHFTWPKSEISRIVPRNAFLLEIITQQHKPKYRTYNAKIPNNKPNKIK